MEEKNEILTAMTQGFERIDQRLERIEGDVSVLKEDVSVLKEDTHKAHLKIEALTDKVDVVAENVFDMRAHIARYDTQVEAPLADRVTNLEARVWVLERKK